MSAADPRRLFADDRDGLVSGCRHRGKIGLTPAQVKSRLKLVQVGESYESHDEDREYP